MTLPTTPAYGAIRRVSARSRSAALHIDTPLLDDGFLLLQRQLGIIAVALGNRVIDVQRLDPAMIALQLVQPYFSLTQLRTMLGESRPVVERIDFKQQLASRDQATFAEIRADLR